MLRFKFCNLITKTAVFLVFSICSCDNNTQEINHINNEKLDTYHRWIEVHILSSLLHLPTINIPIGFNKDGLPIGMQIIGKKYEDLKVLAFAKKYEEIFEQSKTKPKLN